MGQILILPTRWSTSMLYDCKGCTKSQNLKHLLSTMKLSTYLFVLAASVVSASPTPSYNEHAVKVLEKRASVTDAANIGYATQNGG